MGLISSIFVLLAGIAAVAAQPVGAERWEQWTFDSLAVATPGGDGGGGDRSLLVLVGAGIAILVLVIVVLIATRRRPGRRR